MIGKEQWVSTEFSLVVGWNNYCETQDWLDL